MGRFKLINIKSNVANKVPPHTGGAGTNDLQYGEIAVNYNKENPFLAIRDNADNAVLFKPLSKITASASATAGTTAGARVDVTGDSTRDLAFTFTLPKGEPGKDGAKGTDGASASIIGATATATTVSAGSAAKATVTSTGTELARGFKFDFEIPKGEKGDKGDPGTAGAPGATGPTGPKGADGTTISSVVVTSDNTHSSTPKCMVDLSGEGTSKTLTMNFTGLQGKNGSDATYELTAEKMSNALNGYDATMAELSLKGSGNSRAEGLDYEYNDTGSTRKIFYASYKKGEFSIGERGASEETGASEDTPFIILSKQKDIPASSTSRPGGIFLFGQSAGFVVSDDKLNNNFGYRSKMDGWGAYTKGSFVVEDESGNESTAMRTDGVTTKGKMNAENGFFQTSDARKKNFGSDVEINFEELKSIPKKYFEWKDDPDAVQQIGTSAQALLRVYPQIVSKGEDGFYSVDYAKLSIIALAAIDKLDDRISYLESEIKKLKQ